MTPMTHEHIEALYHKAAENGTWMLNGNPYVVDPEAPHTHHHHPFTDLTDVGEATTICEYGAEWEKGFLHCLGYGQPNVPESYGPCYCTDLDPTNQGEQP